jgi:hypothetical protein
MAAPPKTPRLLAARGAITSVGVLLVLALAAGVYVAWTWVPVYVVHYEVKQVVRNFGSLAVKNHDDAQLVDGMVAKIRSLEQVVSEGPDGQRQARPLIELAPEDVTWERVEPASLHVAFDYGREVTLPLLDRRLERVMSVDLTMDISTPHWTSP